MSGIRAATDDGLDDDTIMRHAPSIFVPLKHPDLSSNYRHVPTFEVMGKMREQGFIPVQVSQSSGTVPDTIRGLFARHSIRFRDHNGFKDKQVGDVIPEVVLLNAHDGTGSYQIIAGLFRIVCLNGLVAGDGNVFNIKVRHSGNNNLTTQVLKASETIISTLPTLFDRINRMKDQKLNPERRLKFAQEALKLVPTKMYPDPSEYLTPRRAEDMETDTWSTLNVVQENIIRGGIVAIDRNGSKRRTSAVANVEKDIHINRALWDLAEAA